jgi:hypothetical protein
MASPIDGRSAALAGGGNPAVPGAAFPIPASYTPHRDWNHPAQPKRRGGDV